MLYSWWIMPIGYGEGGSDMGEGGYLKFDNVVHAYGFAVSTWLCWQGLASITQRKVMEVGEATLVALEAMGLGAISEVIEFVAAMTMASNVGVYANTS